MAQYTAILWQIAQEVLAPSEAGDLQTVFASKPISYDDISRLDLSLGGPSMDRLTCHGTGRYDVKDRAVLRPLQYCGTYLEKTGEAGLVEWLTRETVHMSALHLENLLKRVGGIDSPWPLGKLLSERAVRRKLTPTMYGQIDRFRGVYNASKHKTDHTKDSHLFSVEDAFLAYAISRKVGNALYPEAVLWTDMSTFDTNCP